jgi:hypothetical protein
VWEDSSESRQAYISFYASMVKSMLSALYHTRGWRS